MGSGAGLLFKDEVEGIEDAGVGAVFAEIALEDVEQVVIEPAERPDDDGEEDERLEVRGLQQESGGGEQAEEEKEDTFKMYETRGFEVVGEFHGGRRVKGFAHAVVFRRWVADTAVCS
jgi:hypothetical protein